MHHVQVSKQFLDNGGHPGVVRPPVYTMNVALVFAVAVIAYEAISMDRKTQEILRSKRDVEGSLP